MTVTDLAAYAMAVAFILAVAPGRSAVLLRLVLDGHALALAVRLTAGWLFGLDSAATPATVTTTPRPSLAPPDPAPPSRTSGGPATAAALPDQPSHDGRRRV